MTTILQMLTGTPWWVYLLLAYLIIIGVKASKTRIVPLKKLLIVPVLFILLSIHTLLTSFEITAFSLASWLVATLIGISLGWFFIYRLNLAVDKPHLLIQTPGTWSTLLIIIIIFMTKYYFAYELAIAPQLIKNDIFEFSLLAISGVCSGFFVGRLICYLYRLQTNSSVNLKT